MKAVFERTVELAVERDERLADMITDKIVKAWNKGQKN